MSMVDENKTLLEELAKSKTPHGERARKILENSKLEKAASAVGMSAASALALGSLAAVKGYNEHNIAKGTTVSKARFRAENEIRELQAQRRAGLPVSLMRSRLAEIKLREARELEGHGGRAAVGYGAAGTLSGAAIGYMAARGR